MFLRGEPKSKQQRQIARMNEEMTIRRLQVNVLWLLLSLLVLLPCLASSCRSGGIHCPQEEASEVANNESKVSTMKSQSEQTKDMRDDKKSDESRKRQEMHGSASAVDVAGRKGAATMRKKTESEGGFGFGGKKHHQQEEEVGKQWKHHGHKEEEQEEEEDAEKMYETEDYRSYNPSPTFREPPHKLVPSR
eukprot:TRINITY_DN5476_c0_g1_i1.p1 TRINITY_DN5476_c0_g1~~TRINITY_DN5476_c0_g1_i1.p1  ORF type:complete len:191 (-),score=46.23 TRINITY_DN5476_c0_g1_i1:327-899(-)